MEKSIKSNIVNKVNIDTNLKKLIEGKRVCICGPSISQVGTNLGEKIDSYDIVCRINMHLPWKNKEDYGKKTDLLFNGAWPIYDGNLRKDLLKYDEKDSRYYKLMKNTKMVYFIDPINEQYFRNNPYGSSDQSHDKSWNEFKEKFKNNKIKYGTTNIWLTEICKKFIKKTIGVSKELYLSNLSLSNSGMHSILVLLRHNPKELFITGFNFYNWGKGGKLENVYQKGSTDYYNFEYKKGGKKRKKNIIGHVYKSSLLFSKQIFSEYKDIIKLDNILKTFFDTI